MSKWLRVIAILIILGLLFIPTIIAMKYVAISQIYAYFVDSISNLTGINKYLVKAGVASILIPFLIGLRFFFSINRTRRTIGASILVTCLILYNLGLYHFTKASYFSFSEGRILKWYALTPDGVKFFDSSGVDPVYGIPLKPVTPEVIRNLKLLEKGDFKPINPSNVNWFNPITGEPQLWYYHHPDGSFEFYDKPGYHPITGDQLTPVTKQIYFEWRQKAEKKKVKALFQQGKRQTTNGILFKDGRRPVAHGGPSIGAAKTSIPSVDEKESRLAEFKALINKGIARQSGKPNVAIVIESSKTESGISPEHSFYALLRVENVNIITTLFKNEPFKSKGYFSEIYNGNTGLLKEAEALSSVDYLILGKLDYSFRRGAEIAGDLISCNLNLSYKIINKDSEVIKSDSIRVIGPGFSEEAALERGLEILSERYSTRILSPVL